MRSNLGMAAPERSAGAVTELDGLLDSLGLLLQVGRGSDNALRQDVLRLQAHNQQLVQVAAVGDRLNAALPYRETVDQMLGQVKAFLRADFVALLSRNPRGQFTIEGALGVGSRALDTACCPERPDCPLQAAVTQDSLTRSRDHRCEVFPQTMTHQIVLPLTVEAPGQAVLLATSTTGDRFDLIWDEALVTLRGHLQLSLANARKYDSIRRQVVTDHLTGLYNRRYFINRSGEELERSLQEQAPMSIVMIDIDHFKRFNDTFGHGTGDRVLQTVASMLQDAVRVTDTCARHGGEEFTLLLPNTPGDNAVFMANRVRRTLREMRYTGLGLPAEAAITISCGVATCPRDATTVEELLELADKALYRAKEQGRDRVCQYEPEAGHGGTSGRTDGAKPAPASAPKAAGRRPAREREAVAVSAPQDPETCAKPAHAPHRRRLRQP